MRRAALCLSVLAATLVLVASQATQPISELTTNADVPRNVLSGDSAVCRSTGDRLTAVVVSYANNNVCFKAGEPFVAPQYYISNACSTSSAIVPYPADGKFPGTNTVIPDRQFICNLPGTARPDGTIAPAAPGGATRCVSTDRGVCPTNPTGPTGAGTEVNSWAKPRLQTFTMPTYFPISVGSFQAFPSQGADGTYVYPVTINSIQPYSTQSTAYGSAVFDAKCRSAGPANARAILCTDGTNQNYFSAPLDYGFSPSSRSAYTFMTYGTNQLRGMEGSFTNGGMTVSQPQVYAKYTTFAAANNRVLPLTPQKVLQTNKPVYAFDPYNFPTPAFVPIGQTVARLITEGIDRLALINAKKSRFAAANPGATAAQLTALEAKTFSAFYRGESIGIDNTNGQYYGGVAFNSETAANIPDSETNKGYVTQPAWTGCFGPGPQVTVSGSTYVSSYRVSTATTLQTNGGNFFDPRFGSATNSQGVLKSSLPSAPGLSADSSFTCNDWTSVAGTGAGVNTFGIVGDPGITPYTSGTAGTAKASQAYVNNWLSDNLKPQACNVPNQAAYCSWYPTNVDGLQNGDETGVDCGGTTLGADNMGLPTPHCSCKHGQFYDYALALCVPCIQDTYCNLATGCQRECYPCFTAPTSGAVLGNTNQAVWPNNYANPQIIRNGQGVAVAENLNSIDQTAGVGAISPQGQAPLSTPYGASYNTNGQNVILVGTTFNQATQKYTFEATQCFCNVGFAVGTSSTTAPGTPLTGANALFTELKGWSGTGGFKPAQNTVPGFTTLGPFDGSNCVPVVRGDPQITGLQGQDFQVHGIPDEIFNMVSHPDLQVNSRFVFLEDAKCDNYTTCFSHAGTYIDQIGMNIAGQKVKVTAGSLEEGLRVFVEGVELKVGDKRQLKSARVFFSHQRKVHIRTPLFSFAFVGTDKFMNQEVALLDGKLAKLGSKLVTLTAGQERPHQEIPIHGIVGQTWQNIAYPDGMMIEGAVADYRIEEADLFGNSFLFNKFVPQ